VSCHVNPSPGYDWYNEIQFQRIGEVIAVRRWEDNYGIWCRRDQINGSVLWLRAAQYLSRIDPNWCLPGDFLREITVEGIRGWRADVVAFCWCRFGEAKDFNGGRWILGMSERQLAALARQYDIRCCYGEDEPPVIKHLRAVVSLLPKGSGPKHLARLLDRDESRARKSSLERVVKTLLDARAKREDRTGKLSGSTTKQSEER
jgi:hypothetical protein